MKRSRNSTGAPGQRQKRRTDRGGPAKRRFGQHFLEPVWVEKVCRAIAPASSDVFFEVGPGRGALTRPLAAASRHVVAFEIDRELAPLLRDVPRLTVVEGDFLALPNADIRGAVATALDSTASSPAAAVPAVKAALRFAGNLPYNVASPILFKLVDLYADGLPMVDATVMLQREVADRVLASPGSKDFGVLAVVLGRWWQAARLLSLPPGAFRPAPKIHSTVIRLTFHPAAPPVRSEAVFRMLVQSAFTRRRKTLANALLAFPRELPASPRELLQLAALDGSRRPETLRIDEFARLSDVFAEALERGKLTTAPTAVV